MALINETRLPEILGRTPKQRFFRILGGKQEKTKNNERKGNNKKNANHSPPFLYLPLTPSLPPFFALLQEC